MDEAIRLLREKRYEEALRALLALDVHEEEFSELSYYIALCYTHLERYDEAVLYLEQAVTAELDFTKQYQSRMILGYIYAVTERYRLAEFEFARLLDEGYESAKVYAALAHVTYMQQKISTSISHLERALEIDPDNLTAKNSLGFIMADQNIRLSDALNYCRQAVQARPNNPAYLDSLGWAFYKMGKRKDAKRLLEEASRRAPDEGVIREHLRVVSRV
ncbi:MAG: tetratricopeptide repeat protein [Spirochaetaceae bacterium]